MAIKTPSAQIEEIPPAMDYPSHERQFFRVVHLVRWFIVHALLILAALYFMLVGHQPVTGVIFLALGFAALGYGILSTPGIARDVGGAMAHAPEAS